MKIYIVMVLLNLVTVLSGHLMAQQVQVQEQEQEQVHVLHTVDDIKVDGKLDEPAWKAATWITLQGYWPPIPKTDKEQAQWLALLASHPPLALMQQKHYGAMLWHEAGLYCAMRVEDTDVQGQQKKENEWLWLEDVSEFFFAKSNKPDVLHYEYQVNPAGTLYLSSLWTHHTTDIPKPPHPLAAAHVNGSINHSADQDQGYSVEFFLSWDQLQAMGMTRPRKIEQSCLLGYARFATWDLTIHALVRMQRFSLPGKFNSHDTTQYRPMFLEP